MSVEKPTSKIERIPGPLTGMPAAALPPPPDDLSRAVELAVQRQAGDRVRCARVFENYYRCNWWSPARIEVGARTLAAWEETSLHRVRQSRFLRVTNGPGGLHIEEVAGEGSGAGA